MNLETDYEATAMDNLYPALAECFAIIICGYFAGRMNMISETEAKGINTFVGAFSLPALIFMSLAQLDLTSVNWLFLLSILIAKGIVFVSVIIVTVLVRRPVKLGRAGLFAIFCTQSNDFAIGYPIVAALYAKTHPDYASYLYLMAPISLAILNPVSFVLMEVEKRREIELRESIENNISRGNRKSRIKIVTSVAKGIFFNPIIFMTLLGILGNVIFKHSLPLFVSGILEALGSAFSATALFLLGLRMVGKVHTLRGAALVVPGILILTKLLALPLIIREVVSLTHPGNSSETVDLSTYGFLYGTFPTAPTVFVFSTQYNIDIDLIASSMVACTFISAPLMFVSAKMITLTKLNPSNYIQELDDFAFDISIAATVASVWVLITFTITKKIKRIPHRMTTCLVVSQLFSCIGVILWTTLGTDENWTSYLQFCLFTIGVYSSRLWTAFLAVTLIFMQCRSLCFVLKLQKAFIPLGWGLPLVVSVLLLLFDKRDTVPYYKRNPNFEYGVAQALIAVCLLVLCFIVTVGCLILHQRYNKRYARYLQLAQEVASNSRDESEPETDTEGVTDQTSSGKHHVCGTLPTINEGCCEDSSPVVDIEDLLSSQSTSGILSSVLPQPIDVLSPAADGLCPTRFGCQGSRREQCHGIVQRYQQEQDNEVESFEDETLINDPQVLRHIVLLIFLLCSMFVGIAVSVWTLVMEQMSGIYIELSFLDCTLNFGQSLIVFGVFGTDTKDIILPLMKYWHKLWFGANALALPTWDELSVETKHICDQFVSHHLDTCKSDIVKDGRWRLKVYRNVFQGKTFVDWLIEVGLAKDRTEAVNYARHLLEGKVVRHVENVHHFYDRNLLYTFEPN